MVSVSRFREYSWLWFTLLSHLPYGFPTDSHVCFHQKLLCSGKNDFFLIVKLFCPFLSCVLFSDILHPNYSFYSLPSPRSLPTSYHLSQIHPSSTSLQNGGGLPRTSNKHNITRYINTRQKFSHQDWRRQPIRQKKVPCTSKIIKKFPCSHY